MFGALGRREERGVQMKFIKKLIHQRVIMMIVELVTNLMMEILMVMFNLMTHLSLNPVKFVYKNSKFDSMQKIAMHFPLLPIITMLKKLTSNMTKNPNNLMFTY